MARNVIKKPQIKTIKHISATNGGISKSVPATNSIASFSWPLPSYTEAQNLISSGNPEQAIQLLQEEMSELFPFGFSATNGYKIYFYYYKLLGDAYSKADKPVDAIDAYRLALAPVPYSTITNSPIPYAKCLYGLGKQFMILKRWADAEDILNSILNLVENKKVKSNIYLCKSERNLIVGNIDQMEKFAELSIIEAPNNNCQSYHLAAWSKFAKRMFPEAAEYWLDGLATFTYALPVNDVINYLDEALCYWKIFDEGNVKDFYNIIDSIILANTLTSNNAAAITRLLNEKAKIEVIYPDIFMANSIGNDIYILTNFVNNCYFYTDYWKAKSNVFFGLRNALLLTNKLEHKINIALLAEKEKRYSDARAIYKDVLYCTKSITNYDARVQGYNIMFYAANRLAKLNKMFHNSNNKTYQDSLNLCNFAVGLIISNKAGNGVNICMEEFFELLLCKGKLEYYSDASGMEKAIDTYNWASSIFPESIYTKYIYYINKLANTKNKDLQNLKDQFNEIIELPMLRPTFRLWQSYKQSILYFAKESKKIEINNIAKLTAEIYLEGLESAVFDFNAPKFDSCYAVFPLREYTALMELLNQGALNNKETLRLYNWLLKLVLTIPADENHSFYLSMVLNDLRKFSSIERENQIELTLICDATSWHNHNGNNVFVVFDFMDSYIKMEKMLEEDLDDLIFENKTNIYFVTVTIPNDVFRFKYNFFKEIERIPEKEKMKWLEGKFVKDNGNGKMIVKTYTDRDFNLTTVIQCDIQNENIKQLYVMGFPDQLGMGRNAKLMYDDGTHGDKISSDNVFSYSVNLSPSNYFIIYAFLTNNFNKSYNKIYPNEPIKYIIPLNQVELTNYLYYNFNSIKK
ncbi:MAG: hypothetical protein DRI95_15280 [Bacteroidetes bacterium]|nr:MAG: hypothetical protein DRI95_15280 [Bacteroidota bacterium]